MKKSTLDYLFVFILIANLFFFAINYFMYQSNESIRYKLEIFFFLISVGISVKKLSELKVFNAYAVFWVISSLICFLMLIRWLILIIRYLI